MVGFFFKLSILPQHLDIRYANLIVFCFLYSICIASPVFPMGVSTEFGILSWCIHVMRFKVLYASVLLKSTEILLAIREVIFRSYFLNLS